MCKANDKMVKLAKELMELKELQDELQAEIDRVTDQIKVYMGDEEEMQAGIYAISYRSVLSLRVDTATLKKELPDVAARYSKPVETRRFSIK